MKFLISMVLIFSSINFAYCVDNAFVLEDSNNEISFSNRDIQCIKLIKGTKGAQSTISIVLKDFASHQFFKYTANNIGKKLSMSICGAPPITPVIQAAIRGGNVQISLDKKFEKDQIVCLKKTFHLSKKCEVCPVCK